MADHLIRLMLIAEDSEARSEIAARLSDRDDCVVAGEAAPHADVEGLAEAARADVVVWDLGEDADASLARLADAQPVRLPIVAIAGDEHDGIRALAAGAAGLLPPAVDAERLVLTARAVAGGLLALDRSFPEAAAAAVGDAGEEAPVETLTPREREVLVLMAEGLANKAVAERLGITEHTAKFHVHTILGKLNTQSRTEAVVRAARLGLITI
ncbi:MAG TPA: response regulator transcription factor [bacterium]|nr:response regulator transcription factor [bacterium]